MVTPVSRFILKYREEQKLSQTQLGMMLGTSGQYISNVECGRNAKAVGLCLRLMRILPPGRRRELMDVVSEVQEKFFNQKLKNALAKK